jgi:hypothetical protein
VPMRLDQFLSWVVLQCRPRPDWRWINGKFRAKVELARRIRKIGGWFSFRNDKVLPRSRTLSTNPALKARAGSRFLESLNATPTTAAKDFVGFIGPATISLRR